MPYNVANPIIVQSDKSVLLEVSSPLYNEARDQLARFAELEKSPEHIHTYRITPLSLWNAAAAGETAETIIEALRKYSKFDLPSNIVTDVRDYISRFGRVKLIREEGSLFLRSSDALLITEISRHKRLVPFLRKQIDRNTLEIDPAKRGHVKQALVQFGYPAEDLAGYVDGAPLALQLLSESRSKEPFNLRHYQQEAAEIFYAGGSSVGGSGVVVLPCGAGKTVVGLAVLNQVQAKTLILCPNTIAVRQWIKEILDKTTLLPDDVGEYTGERKEIRPITVTTYQIMTYKTHGKAKQDNAEDGTAGAEALLATLEGAKAGGRKSRVGKGNEEVPDIAEYPHFELFTSQDWGLIIYDEVHLLPAPVFRITAEIQARRRLGLTATLVREDGREEDVFSLIGPKRYDVPWKDLEKQGWIATAECCEVRLDMGTRLRSDYVMAEDPRIQYRIAAENPLKIEIMRNLLEKHREDNILIIGQYLHQLKAIATEFNAPLITGAVANTERAKLYEEFREGRIRLLVVSKVANFAIDLPDANVAIQVSGTFGSRQEEAQRLGRILRPKKDGRPAFFYSVVTRDSKDQDYSVNRQLFLTEQGYHYTIIDAADLLGPIYNEHLQAEMILVEKMQQFEEVLAKTSNLEEEDDELEILPLDQGEIRSRRSGGKAPVKETRQRTRTAAGKGHLKLVK